MSRNFSAEIRENRALTRNYNILSLVPDGRTEAPLPGQFYMIEVNRGTDPLLKRPFSIFRGTSEHLQLLYRITGRGTALLRAMGKGASVDLLGPLGTSYPVLDERATPLLVAGGVGIASIFPLISRFSGRALVFYGARTGDDLVAIDEIQQASAGLAITTDDGSRGEKGTVISALDDFIRQRETAARFVIYACGPRPVLREVSRIAAAYGMKAYISLEEHMACGIGACLGCVVRTRSGYQRVCKEGPVFDSREIVW